MKNISRLFIVFTFTIALFYSVNSSAKINILFPEDNQTVAVSDIHIVGISDTDKNVVIKIDGEKYIKSLLPSFTADGKKNYMLMSILKLQPGKNEITIKQSDFQKTITVDKVESPVVIEDWTEKLSSFHSNESKKEVCKKCHKFQNIKDCVNCHKDKLLGKWVHKPVQRAKCFKCHQRENEFKPVQPFSDTCLSCHEEFNKMLEKKAYVHGPVAAGYCTICHSPHKSTNKTHLRNFTNELCEQCHISETMGYKYHQNSYIKEHPVKGKVIEKTGERLTCASCHNPHYADDKMFLTIKGGKESELCKKCHDEKDTKKLLEKLSE